MEADLHETVVAEGDDEHADAAWRLKERVRREDGGFQQSRPLFDRAYRFSTVYLAFDSGESPAGLNVVRGDGHMLLLCVAPDHRGRGLGRRLVDRAGADHRRVSCHVRAANENARGFYRHLGFAVDERIPGYYEDGDDALVMVLRGGPAPG